VNSSAGMYLLCWMLSQLVVDPYSDFHAWVGLDLSHIVIKVPVILNFVCKKCMCEMT
jgi:hypothetical protein